MTVGELTFESAAYVARYVVKKRTGKEAKTHYTRMYESGELVDLKPEFVTMSRRPGIGNEWFKKYKNDVYPKDFTTIRGKRMKPPKYYDRLLEELDPDVFERIKQDRRDSAA